MPSGLVPEYQGECYDIKIPIYYILSKFWKKKSEEKKKKENDEKQKKKIKKKNKKSRESVKLKKNWLTKVFCINCLRLVLNQRPLGFQPNALPLSY